MLKLVKILPYTDLRWCTRWRMPSRCTMTSLLLWINETLTVRCTVSLLLNYWEVTQTSQLFCTGFQIISPNLARDWCPGKTHWKAKDWELAGILNHWKTSLYFEPSLSSITVSLSDLISYISFVHTYLVCS